MQFLPEILIAFLILLSLTIYFLAKKPLYNKKKNALLIVFKDVRAKSLNLQDTVTKHIINYDAINEKITDTLTYGQLLKQLKKDHITYLSGKKQTRIRATNNLFRLHKTENILKELDDSLTQTEKMLSTRKK